jgi:hypothetical protein
MTAWGCVLDSVNSSPYNARTLLIGPAGPTGAQVAQLVEHVTENHGVGGSIPPLGTIPKICCLFCSAFS